MTRFRFRLQRVLDYRTSLVDAQEVEVARHLALVSAAHRELQAVRHRQAEALSVLDAPSGPGLDPARSAAAWSYLDYLRHEERRCQEQIASRSIALAKAQERLAELKRDEQVMQKLKDRGFERARLEALRQETKTLDDLTNARHQRHP